MNKVPVGPATYVGYLTAALAAGLAAWAEAEGTGQAKWLAIIAGALAALTNFNRSIQAPKQVAEPVEVLTERPASAVTPEVPPAPPAV